MEKIVFSKKYFRIFFILLFASTFCVACDYNIEVDNIKRVFEKISGVVDCREKPGSASNTKKIRLFLVDKNNASFMIPSDRISTLFSSLKVASGENAPKLLDANGNAVAGSAVTLNVVQSAEIKQFVNPNYDSIFQNDSRVRVPNAISLLLDSSDQMAFSDSSMNRLPSVTGWLNENKLFNDDSSKGLLDAFQVILMRGDRVDTQDNLFRSFNVDNQILSFEDNKPKGFVASSKDNKESMNIEILKLGSSVNGNAPIYAAIRDAAISIKNIALNDAKWIYNPGIVSIVSSIDADVKEGRSSKLSDALSSLKETKTLNGESVNIMIPVMNLVFPRPDTIKQEVWDKQVSELCELSTKAGINTDTYYGNVFQILPLIPASPDEAFRTYLKRSLDTATHALQGYHEISVEFTVTGAEKGKRYYVEFALEGEWLKEKTTSHSRITFEFEGR